MTRLIVGNLSYYKRRLLSTVVAVFLGVALLSGTLALGDTMSKSIQGFFAESNAGVDAVVRNATSVSDDPGTTRAGIDAGLVQKVRRVDGVAAAAPVIKRYGQIVGADGAAITGNGPRNAGNWVADPQLNPWQIAAGHAPRGPDQVVIDKASAESGDLAVGDTTTVLTPEPVRVTIAGVATFGAQDSFGGSSFAAFTLAGAQQHLADRPGTVTRVAARAVPGVDEQTLVGRIQAVLPQGVEAVSGTAVTEENVESVQQSFLSVFQVVLTAFGVIALLVATFSIYNTFSIIAAQRRRESALLRAVGATRRQVTVSALVEALAVGALGSGLGIGGGVLMAYGLKGLFAGFGMSLPTIELVVSGSSLLISALVGLAVSVLAGLVPAVRGSRVPPVAAMRDSAVEDPGVSARRTTIGAVVTVAGLVLAIAAAAGGTMPLAAVGAVVLAAGMVVFGPAAAVPASRILGWPAATWRGVTGAMSRQNAMRSPRRTAGSANALLIGAGLVTLVSVLAASLQASFEDRAGEAFSGDLVVGAGSGVGSPTSLSPKVTETLQGMPQVQTAAAITRGRARVDGDGVAVSVGSAAQLRQVLSLDPTAGSLSGRTFAVSAAAADEHGWDVGSSVPITFADGRSERLRIGALYAQTAVVGDYLLPKPVWRPHTTQRLDSTVYVSVVPGADATQVQRSVEEALSPYGDPPVLDREEYVASQGRSVGMILNMVYVLLALAIVIALMGIANTLSLSVRERTRELGLLRAVGQTRRQTRRMVRGESLIVAVFGTVGGVLLGGFLGAIMASAMEDIETVEVPIATLVVVLVVGAVAGVWAGRRPARHAARTDVLTAIGHE